MKKLLILTMTIAFSCTTGKMLNSNKTTNEDYKSIATKKLGEDVDYYWSDDKAYVLCTYEINGSSQQPFNSLYYLVIKADDNSIVLENSVSGGTVSWYNQKMIQVYKIPGMIRKDQERDDFITLYNVETGKSYPKNQKETH